MKYAMLKCKCNDDNQKNVQIYVIFHPLSGKITSTVQASLDKN